MGPSLFGAGDRFPSGAPTQGGRILAAVPPRLECEPLCVFRLSNTVLLFTQRVRLLHRRKKGTSPHSWSRSFFGAGDRGRTDTVSLPLDFESSTSANSITPAYESLDFPSNTHSISHFFEKIKSFFHSRPYFFQKNDQEPRRTTAWPLSIINLPSCERSWKSKPQPAAS